jgi:hypothetical protein
MGKRPKNSDKWQVTADKLSLNDQFVREEASR